MKSGRRPLALFVLPLLAVVVLAISAVTHATAGAVTYAQVLGGPPRGPVWHGRVRLVEEAAGVVRGVGDSVLRLSVVSTEGRSSDETVRRIRTGPQGWAEFSIPYAHAPGAAEVRVQRADVSEPLASGTPGLSLERWRRSARVHDGRLKGHTSGPLVPAVRVEPPVLSVPFEATLLLKSPVPAEIEMQVEGAKLIGPVPAEVDGSGETAVGVTPFSHVATLHVKLRADDGDEGERFGSLPVIPGSSTFFREDNQLTVASPIERSRLWYAVVGPWGRGPGGRVELTTKSDGTARGILPLERLTVEGPGANDRYLLLSSQADGRSPSTVGLPLDGQGKTFDAVDAYLLNGGPAARRHAERRRARIRWILAGYAAMAGLATVAVFVASLRREERELRRRFREAGVVEQAHDERRFLPTAALLSLFFAFSLAVLWIVGR